jgi:ABC-type cobalamin/Fe3+-siderophores transport system ATPase subunit
VKRKKIMRLVSFQIQNFRSIQDCGRCEISAEDVAVLIGQNEAGKSSLLEALMAFQNGKVDTNDLRSDGTLPTVICEYDISIEEVKKWFTSIAAPTDENGFLSLPKQAVRVAVLAQWLTSNTEECVYSFECPDLAFPINDYVSIRVEANSEVMEARKLIAAFPESPDVATHAEKVIRISKVHTTDINNSLIEALLSKLPVFVLFNDADCLLPSTIDIVNDELDAIDGRAGAANYLTVAGLDLKVISNTSDRHRATMLTNASKGITADFQKFWTQQIGKTQKVELECDLKFYGHTAKPEKNGKPYLVFYISEATDKLYPSQRSKGVRWFLSFFLQMWAASKSHKSVVFLLDEPGANLHSKAQQDVLQVIERSCSANQVIYSTHSPDLIRADKLARVLAVQRDDTEDNSSPTTVISAHRLSSASVDTMSAVYRAMGTDFSRQQVIQRSNNVVIEELSALYYLKAFYHLIGIDNIPNFLPATGVTNIPMITNLLVGWGIEFIVLLDDDSSGRRISQILGKELFLGDETISEKRVLRIKKCDGIEDLFEPTDFSKFILNREDHVLTGNCSAAAKDESKGMLAYRFWCRVEQGEITISELTEATAARLRSLLDRLNVMLVNYSDQRIPA